MPYTYVANEPFRLDVRHLTHGHVVLSCEEGDVLDHDDAATAWAIDERLIPRGLVKRTRGGGDAQPEED